LRAVTSLPYEITEEDHVRIPMSDGTVLSARIRRPVSSDTDPVPAILEHIPYRKRDLTAPRDSIHHPYLAGHGYACVRVDLRGTGESEGVLADEYLEREQLDAKPRCRSRRGNRQACARLSLSTSYWPPTPALLSVHTGHSVVELPVRPVAEPDELPARPFGEPAGHREERGDGPVRRPRPGGHPERPRALQLGRRRLLLPGGTRVSCTGTGFVIDAQLDGYDGARRIVSRNRHRRIPRDLV
jgi:hypothetical protein